MTELFKDMDGMPGVVTASQYLYAADGRQYKSFWCAHWTILTDKLVPIKGFESSEKWVLVAQVGNAAKMLIPGCRVTGWSRCGWRIKSSDTWAIE